MQAPKAAVVLLVNVSLLVTACVPPSLDTRRGPPLTPVEATRLEELQAAAERVRVAYGAGCLAKPCAPGFLIRDALEAVAIWDGPAFRIWLVRRALAPGFEPRPAVAHELGHWLLGHTSHACATRMFECETAANAEAVRILTTGWAMSHEEAVSLMYASLLAGLRRGTHARGHENPCRELALFAETFERPLPPCAVNQAR
jgi:hypothetical protein